MWHQDSNKQEASRSEGLRIPARQRKQSSQVIFLKYFYYVIDHFLKFLKSLCDPCASQRASVSQTAFAHTTLAGYPVKGRYQLLVATLSSSQPISFKAVMPLTPSWLLHLWVYMCHSIYHLCVFLNINLHTQEKKWAWSYDAPPNTEQT